MHTCAINPITKSFVHPRRQGHIIMMYSNNAKISHKDSTWQHALANALFVKTLQSEYSQVGMSVIL